MRPIVRWLLILACLLAPLSPARSEVRIVDRPIPFDQERIDLTLSYLKRHYGLDLTDIEITPKAVVVHWTDTPSFKVTWRRFGRTRVSSKRGRLRAAGLVNVSVHFLVDRDGTIYRLMPETWAARHCIGLNYDAIGIENVGDGRRWPLTDAQLDANAELIAYLAGKYPIRALYGHFESERIRRSPFFRETDPGYRTVKRDPGRRFMKRLRVRLRGLPRGGLSFPTAKRPRADSHSASSAEAVSATEVAVRGDAAQRRGCFGGMPFLAADTCEAPEGNRPESSAPPAKGAADGHRTRPRPEHERYPWPRRAASYEPLLERFAEPPGFRRQSVEEGSFAAWLRHLPLLAAGSPVRTYRGRIVLPADHPALAAVVDLDLGPRNRQQCADTIMRLWGEYRHQAGLALRTSYAWKGRRRFAYREWAAGIRPVRGEGGWRFVRRAARARGYRSFRSYLSFLFAWTGTWQLRSEKQPAVATPIAAGDFFVHAGSPGHAVIVLDVARAAEGAAAAKVLVAQGFMPAQDLHVLRAAEGSSWFSVTPGDPLPLPLWGTFQWSDRRRFADR